MSEATENDILGGVMMRLPTIYLPRFVEALEKQLVEDAKRWGETWLKRPREGQETRTMEHITSYFDQYSEGGRPIPWLKIAGLALICWAREQPDYPPNDAPALAREETSHD